jgi:hypothetical protein
MEELTMPTNRIPKATHSRTLAQSIFVNLVAQLLLAFSQPMLAQSQQKPFASVGQNSQALNETLRGSRDEGGKPTGRRSQVQSRQSDWVNNLAGPKRVGRSQRKEVAYVDTMLSPL